MLERGEIRLVGYGSRLSLEIKVGHVNVKIIHEVISFKLIRPYRTSQIMMRIEKKVIFKPRGKISVLRRHGVSPSIELNVMNILMLSPHTKNDNYVR